MKFNLKNRPKPEKNNVPMWLKPYETWFEGFEKELREMYAHQKIIYKIPTVSIKEVLGE